MNSTDDITRLAERAAEMLDMFEQALVQYAPIADIERWPYHPEITDTAEALRTLAQQGKAGGVPDDRSKWTLHDRVEFALRDAGFDYDDAFNIAYAAANPREAGVTDPPSLLRKPGPLPPGCFCTPGHCMAPKIGGRQAGCRDPEKALAPQPKATP